MHIFRGVLQVSVRAEWMGDGEVSAYRQESVKDIQLISIIISFAYL